MALFHIYCYADVTYFFPQPAVYHETLLFLLLLLSLQKKKKKKAEWNESKWKLFCKIASHTLLKCSSGFFFPPLPPPPRSPLIRSPWIFHLGVAEYNRRLVAMVTELFHWSSQSVKCRTRKHLDRSRWRGTDCSMSIRGTRYQAFIKYKQSGSAVFPGRCAWAKLKYYVFFDYLHKGLLYPRSL